MLRKCIRQLSQWRQLQLDNMPASVELLLPRLLDEAAALGVELPREPYAKLMDYLIVVSMLCIKLINGCCAIISPLV